MRLVATAMLCLLALSACDRGEKTRERAYASAAAGSAAAIDRMGGFTHEPGFDAQGFYVAKTPIEIKGLRLTHLALGAPSDFDAWEAGKREEVFGPVFLQFEDLKSPIATGEPGDHHTVTARVMPTAYLLTPGAMVFKGTDARLGDIILEGSFDTRALAKVRAEAGGEASPVFRGKMQVAGQTLEGLQFTYFAGD